MYVFVVAVVGKMATVAFPVSQGSAATWVRCGGKHYNKSFIAEIMHKYSGMFFDSVYRWRKVA